ncbi:MAG TPA: NIPSNAP family protein [Streptosporangiaceae bacterium]|jgi:hypothetical protein
MILELRVYEVAPGRMAEMHQRFKDHTLRIFKKHGFEPVLFCTSEIGETSDKLTYILQFENLRHREEAWAAFHADEEWLQAKAGFSKEELVVRFRSTILKPTDYSPLR